MASITNQLMANHEAEKSVLGAFLMAYGRDRELEQILMQLDVRDFVSPRHKEIFRAMQQLQNQKKPIDLITVDEACGNNPDLLDEMIELSRFVPTSANTKHYAEILKRATARRDFAALADKIRESSADDDFDASKLTENIRLYLKGMHQTGDEETAIQNDIMNMYDAVMGNKSEAGIMMNIPSLDSCTGGLKKGRMYVVGARPSVGKTVFGMIAAVRAALEGKSVLYINREMEKVDMLKRMTANLSGINMNAMEGGCVPEDQWDKLLDTVTLMGNMKIHISNRARTPAQIRAKAVELKESDGLGLVVVDYLQRMSAGEKYKSRDEEVGAISMALKDLSMDLGVPVVLLSQLNRSASNTRPNMAMLRESGNIEQDADVVILLHAPDAADVPAQRRDQYRTITTDRGRYLEMIVDKNRHGSTGIVPVAFYGDKMRYVPLTKER